MQYQLSLKENRIIFLQNTNFKREQFKVQINKINEDYEKSQIFILEDAVI